MNTNDNLTFRGKPIMVEFRDPNTNLLLNGDQAWTRIGRLSVINTVKNFEQNNPNYSSKIFEPDGSYEDKDFVKAGYESYLALSHLNELKEYILPLSPIVDKTIAAEIAYAFDHPTHNAIEVDPVKTLLPELAQIYLAKGNGLTKEQIDFMVNYESKNPEAYISAERMNMVREAFQNGQTIDDIKKYIDKPFPVADAISHSHRYVTPEQFNILSSATDMNTVYSVSISFEFDKISNDVGKAIIDFSNKLDENPDLKNSFPYWFRTDGKTDIFIALASKADITADEVKRIGDIIINSGKCMEHDGAMRTLNAIRNVRGFDEKEPKKWIPPKMKNEKNRELGVER